MEPRLTDDAQQKMAEASAVQRRIYEVFDIIVAEFESDPMSVQCFDLRIVEEAKQLSKRMAASRKDDSFYFWGP